jgi:predicted DNA-binding transcriptional regulator YafY
MGMSKSELTCLLTPQAVRFCRIERMLRRGRCVSFAALRDQLGCSTATLKRDIQALREELGAPIRYEAPAGYRITGLWVGVAATLFEQLESV